MVLLFYFLLSYIFLDCPTFWEALTYFLVMTYGHPAWGWVRPHKSLEEIPPSLAEEALGEILLPLVSPKELGGEKNSLEEIPPLNHPKG